MQTNTYFTEQFSHYDDNDSRYRDANKVLYQLVEDRPHNLDANQVVTKFWIIGRTYAAAVERRANKTSTPGDFYYDHVAPAIIHSDLDVKIEAIKAKHYEGVCEESLRDVLEVHGYLVRLLQGITEKEKRSLASKYLHFHLPELVFIYDSRVSQVIGRFVDGKINTRGFDASWDQVYAKFAYKAYEIYKTLGREEFASAHGDTLPRVIDNFLLRYCDALRLEGGEE